MSSLPPKPSKGLWAAALLLAGWGGASVLAAPPDGGDAVVRRTLVQVIQAEGAGQQRLLGELSDSGSKVAHDVLMAWTRGEIYLIHQADGSSVPVLLEEQQDSAGKARAIRIADGQIVRDAQGHDLRFDPNALDTADTDMRLRSAIQQVLDALTLADPDPDARRAAVVKLGNSQKRGYIAVLEARRTREPDESVRKAIDEAVALLRLGDPDPGVQVGAVRELSRLNSIGSLDNLKALAAKPATAPAVAKAAGEAVEALQRHIERVNFFGTIFRGLSLGSILLVVALGLAITFGLMGVINMAHGEMIAVGAYTCYVVQNLFGAGFRFAITLPFTFFGRQVGFGLSLPGLNASGWVYQGYFLVAIPLSFLTGALAGLLLERTVIRFLYRRPLESLLATWGVSLFMQQCFRMVFGSNNVDVDSPSWLLGHFSIHDVSFGYNRVFVIGFAIMIVFGTWLLLTRTPLGLLIRSVMQNRDMAACMGVRTNRVNMMTFAFGSGLAGLAGAFLSQIGNVGPSLGQNYIVDSFMVVVVGGVGSIVGTVCASLGIGTVDQVLQQLLQSPVVGKITVLIAIILFLQWKPGGLFATKSRSLD
jgi:urea transport system permease protein